MNHFANTLDASTRDDQGGGWDCTVYYDDSTEQACIADVFEIVRPTVYGFNDRGFNLRFANGRAFKRFAKLYRKTMMNEEYRDRLFDRHDPRGPT